MGKKRKSIASRLDEVDRTMYSSFSGAANSLSQLYTHAMNQQKLSFQAGERHGLEKVYQWISRQIQEGSKVSASDIIAYLQNEIDYGGEDVSTSPRLQPQHQHSLPSVHFSSSGGVPISALLGQQTGGHVPRPGHSEQAKNSVFSNALSSPIRRSLQPYQLAQAGYCPNNVNGNGARNPGMSSPSQNRDASSLNSIDSMMDMHSDSPPRESDMR